MLETKVDPARRSFSCTLVEYLTPLRVCATFFLYALVLLALYVTIWSKEGISGTEGNDERMVLVREQWLANFLVNMAGYASILFPFMLLINLSEPLLNSWKSDKSRLGRWASRVLYVCFSTNRESDCDLPISTTPPSSNSANASPPAILPSLTHWIQKINRFNENHRWLLITFYALGLNAAYVVWGVVQERIMTRSYEGQRFTEPQFLVLGNRLGAVLVSGLGLWMLGRLLEPTRGTTALLAPLSAYSLPAFTNIISSWCQYEALLFISFPLQVVSKSCKIIPVMLVGFLLHRRSYSLTEYATAGLISAGVSLVVISSPVNAHKTNSATFDSLSGCVLIVGYILLDSVTSTTQENLFKLYRLSALKMMFGCGCWAVAFTLVSLAGKNNLVSSLTFAQEHPLFLADVALSALCSGLGQILIFLTISHFGAATFVIIMTIRQALSILVSCLLFDHPMNPIGLLGFCVTFSAVFFRIFYRKRRPAPANNSS